MKITTTAEQIVKALFCDGLLKGPILFNSNRAEHLIAGILERERREVRRVLEQALDGNYWHGGGCAGADGVSRCNCWVADAHALLALLAKPQPGKEP